MTPVRLKLLGRIDCELCDELHAALITDSRVADVGLEFVDIDVHPDLRAIYTFRVPVLFNGEQEIYAGRPDPVGLAAALNATFGSG